MIRVTDLVAVVVAVGRRKVKRGEGRGVGGFAGRCEHSCVVEGRCNRVWRAGVAVVAGKKRQRSDYGQAVDAGSLRLRQGAGCDVNRTEVARGAEGGGRELLKR